MQTEAISRKVAASYDAAACNLIRATKLREEYKTEMAELEKRIAENNALEETSLKLYRMFGELLFDDPAYHGTTFGELFQHFEAAMGGDSRLVASWFGITTAATYQWKESLVIPKRCTWDTIADLIEEKSMGFYTKDEVLTLLRSDMAKRKESEAIQADTDTVQPPDDDSGLFPPTAEDNAQGPESFIDDPIGSEGEPF